MFPEWIFQVFFKKDFLGNRLQLFPLNFGALVASRGRTFTFNLSKKEGVNRFPPLK